MIYLSFKLLTSVLDNSRFNNTIRNLVINYINFEIFERSYLLYQICYNIQAVYFKRNLNQLLIQAINCISCLQNLYRSRKLDNRQQEQIKYSKIIQNLYIARQNLSQKIYNSFDTLKKTKTENLSLYTKYFRTQHLLVATICAEERFLLKTIQQKYNRQTLIDNIERQFSSTIVKTDVLLFIYKRFKLVFLKRSRIEEILFFEKLFIFFFERDSNWRVLFINNLIALYRQREYCFLSKRCKNRNIKNKNSKLKKKKSAIFELYFL